MDIHEDEYNALYHYGTPRHSGRYPWGSGDTPYAKSTSFLAELANMRREGMTDTEIAKGWGITTSQLRNRVTLSNQQIKAADIARAQRLRDEGNSQSAIGRIMGKNESSIRALLKEGEEEKNAILQTTADTLRRHVEKKKFIDVGAGVEYQLGISKEKLKAAVNILKDEGYTLHYTQVPQLGTGKKTSVKYLAGPGVTGKEAYANRHNIQQIHSRSKDGGRSFEEILPPLSIDSKRVKVRYAEEGGTDADGTIYVRPGVKDVELGGSRYAQVRIAVDGTHYLKGMAIYNDKDMPPGVDLVFNTNKKNTGNKLDAMKKMKTDQDGKIDKEDPFGSMISDQIKEVGTFGEPKVTSVMNIVNKENDWDDWSKTLSSQMLSKQKRTLAKEQLDLTYESKKREYDLIMSLTNPTVKKHLLKKFAESTDASAVHLKAAHLPRQATKVILPVNSLKDDEVYAPTFNDGERVVLVRFPHGHISEIPELKVNNRHTDARKLIGTHASDAIGINSRVAERLSGADFDGDTVLVIPNDHGKVKNQAPLEGLIGFDPRSEYPKYDGMPVMDSRQKGIEMGKISNLITDMTVRGAPDDEIVRAVKHSMVVIDAEKHELNYKQSALDNGILSLQRKYQTKANGTVGGAATLISRATSETRINARKPRAAKDGGPIDPATGKLMWVETGEKYDDDNLKKIKSTKLADTDDAHTLVSEANTPMERVYADHSNRLKDLANQARKEMVATPDLVRSPSAAKQFAEQVKNLDSSLRLALENAPHERQAQIVANAEFRIKKQSNPDLDDADLKKMKAKAIKAARIRVGAEKQLVKISDKEWEAIQAGAISKTQLEKILDNTDVDRVKELATPKEKKGMSTADIDRAMAMLRNPSGPTTAEVANLLGVSVSTLNAALRGDA
jgi:DNA-binding phage protein